MITIYNIRPKGFNVGNEAIFVAMQRYLYKVFDGFVNIITIPATSAYESHGMAGLTAKTVYEINQHGHGVIVGGGNLYENNELDVNLNALKAIDVPLMLFSLSRGRIYNRKDQLTDRTDVMPDNVIKALHDRADYALSRDQATYDYATSIGCDNAVLGGCPTVFLSSIVDKFPNIDSIDNQFKNTVILSIRSPTLINVSAERQAKVRDEVMAMIDYFQGQGSEVKLLCHDLRDLAFATSIPTADHLYTADVYSYLNIIQRCKLLVSYRLHSFLPALSFGTPAIKISYDERGLSLIDTLGLSDWNINMVESQDLIMDVKDRHERINDLNEIQEKAIKVWQKYDDVMTSTFESFAADVIKTV